MTEPGPANTPEEGTPEPAPRGPAGLILPTLVGMVIGVAVILLLLWMR